MKLAIIFTLVAFLSVAASVVNGQAISPPVSEKYPFAVGTMMDGGTLYIHEKPTKESDERKYCVDNQINSKTAGELFVGNLHPTHEGAKLVRGDEARKILDHIEATLRKFHGEEALERYRKEPIDFEAISEEEAEEMIKDPKFNDRVATQILLEAIKQYHKSHKAEQAGTEQPATRPQSKPEGDEKPQPEAEGRSR
jgi:hypothetical protein